MASLSVTIFIMILPLILFLLFLKKDLVPTKTYINLLARRCCLAISLYLMTLNAAIIATIAAGGEIAVTRELFTYMELYGWAGYVVILIIVFRTLIDLLDIWNETKKEKRGY